MIGISVQETNPADVAAYAAKYAVGYTIAADLSADVLHLYRVYSLPTQVFIGPDGRIRKVLTGPLSPAQAAAEVEAILPSAPAGSATPGGSAVPASQSTASGPPTP
jgi:peroxiredoxin